MAAKPIRLITNAASFPFVYSYTGRTTLSMEDLAPRLPAAFYGDSANSDYSVPQLIYCENVLPYAKGLFSVGYTKFASAISPATVLCDQAIPLRDAAENQFTFVPALGANYVYNPSTNVWASVNPFTFSGKLVTRAYVNGRTFICYEKNRIIEYNSGAGTFTTISLTFPAGLTITNVRGIFHASNYLCLFTDISIYWCSPLNLLDFATIDQGAGQQTPIDIEGQITGVLPCAGGFIIYTTKNAIGATFTNNGNAPFVYKKIKNAGGVAGWERITPEADDGDHYIFGTNGLQKVALSGSLSLFPDATDFLVGGQYETWDPTAKKVVLTSTNASFSTKLAFVAGRYLVISYSSGSTTYGAALIYDTILKRWGKLNIDHVDVYMYTYPIGSAVYTYDTLPGYWDGFGDATYDSWGIVQLNVTPAKQGISFLKANGEIWALNPNFNAVGNSGLVIFGHIEQMHARLVTILSAEFEGLQASPAPVVSLLSSTDGYSRNAATQMQYSTSSADVMQFHSTATAKNFDLVLEGSFVLSTAMIRVMNNGYR